MEEQLLKKMDRLIDLSHKFSKSKEELFSDDISKEHTSVFSGNITIGSQSSNIFTINNRQIYVDEYGNVKSKDNTPLSLANSIRFKYEIKAILADEFDEYNNLREELKNYFSALTKIKK